MGIALGVLTFLLAEGVSNPRAGRRLTLGRQGVAGTASELDEHAAAAGYMLRTRQTPAGGIADCAAGPQYLNDEQLFGALGFSAVSGHEGAELIHGLNNERLSTEWLDRYDAILDGGTLEHVFDVHTAMHNLCKMTKVGGRIVHVSPMANCVDHGFYSFSPTLFVDYYVADGWDIRRTVCARFRRDRVHDKWEFAEYTPGCFPTLGVLDDATYFLLVCVQRWKEPCDDRVPQQSYFRERVWQHSDRVPGVDEES